MKKYYFPLFWFLAVVCNSKMVHAQWITETCPTNCNLNAIAVTRSGSYWIAGDFGTILYKSEGDWKSYPKTTPENLYSICFISGDNGWAVGAKGTILHFDGEKWENYPSPTKNDLYSVSFSDKENGNAVGKSGTILLYRSGSWILVENNNRGDFNATTYENNAIWLGGGLECVGFPIIKIQNENNSLPSLSRTTESFATIKSIFFLNSSNGWAVGSPSALLHYDGQSWRDYKSDEKFPSLNYVCFSEDERSGISVGYNGTILSFSKDKWIKEISGITQNLKSAVIDENNVYVVGDLGTIICKKLRISNETSSANEIVTLNNKLIPNAKNNSTLSTDNEPIKFQLLPNPCDDFLNIKLIYGNSFTKGTLIVNNINGQLVLQKVIGFTDSNNTQTLETEGFANGVYMLIILSEGKSSTNKFIVNH
jgi:photosystem II stability/assembly factor-like uncharacterized protein